MDELRILSPTGILGYGFPIASFREGMRLKPHVIGVDAGSTDPGPYYLGAGKSFVPRENVVRDLDILISASLKARIPLIIGSAGGSGAKPHVDWCLEIVREILRKHKLHAKVALIYTDVPHEQVKVALHKRKIQSLPFVPKLTAESIDQTTYIVAQAGVEPLLLALEKDVNIVLSGRCYDPLPFAALPIRLGYDPGLAVHMGKILECAAIAATPGSGRDCVLGVLREDHFILRPLSRERRFTTESVAAHSLYEKSNPIVLPGPGGHLDLSQTTFRQINTTCVEVRGSRFVPSPKYTLKLEGARALGFRTISIAGVRDEIMIQQLPSILKKIHELVRKSFPGPKRQLLFRVYGKNGVMGELEPQVAEPCEVGILMEVLAETQEKANAICGFARSTLLHYGYPERISTAGNLAFPFSPSDFGVGQAFEFSLYHLMEVDNPSKLFPITVKRL